MMRLLAAVSLGTALALAGCGETSQQVSYTKGRYAGKPDTPAWISTPVSRPRTCVVCDSPERTSRQVGALFNGWFCWRWTCDSFAAGLSAAA